MGNLMDDLFCDEEIYDADNDKSFCCTRCGEYCSEDEWNDDDICDSCYPYEDEVFIDHRGFMKSNNCGNHKIVPKE